MDIEINNVIRVWFLEELVPYIRPFLSTKLKTHSDSGKLSSLAV